MAHSQSLTNQQPGWKWPRKPSRDGRIVRVASALAQTHIYIDRVLAKLDGSRIWERVRPNLPALGNLLLHMEGTEHQWIGHKVGGLPLSRDRDFEFACGAESGLGLMDITTRLHATWSRSEEVLDAAPAGGDLEEILFCLHYTENHLAYHTGQLVFAAKVQDERFMLY